MDKKVKKVPTEVLFQLIGESLKENRNAIFTVTGNNSTNYYNEIVLMYQKWLSKGMWITLFVFVNDNICNNFPSFPIILLREANDYAFVFKDI